MKRLLIIAMLIVMAVYPTQSFACSINILPFETVVILQDTIAIGTITAITDEEITFQIEEYLKGSETSPTLVVYRHDDWLSLVKEQPLPDPDVGIDSCPNMPILQGKWEQGGRYLILIPAIPIPNDRAAQSAAGQGTIQMNPASDAITRPVGLKRISQDTILIQKLAWQSETLTLEEVRTIIKTKTGAIPHQPMALPTAQPQQSLLPWLIGGGVGIVLGGIALIVWRRRPAV